MIAPPGNPILEGQMFSLSDGINTLTFEFNDQADRHRAWRRAGCRSTTSRTTPTIVIAQRIRTAINSPPGAGGAEHPGPTGRWRLGTGSTTNQVNLIGPVSVPVPGGVHVPTLSTTHDYGDRNRFRDQGQIILQGNEISNSSQWGILIDAGARNAADGNAPHNGPCRILREAQLERLVPGVVVTNNVIHNNAPGRHPLQRRSATADRRARFRSAGSSTTRCSARAAR